MTEKRRGGLVSRLFELRSVIGILFAIYGLVCTVWGLAFTSQRELEKAAGVNVNLWTGIAMLVVAAAFFAWAVLNPAPETVKEAQEGVDGKG
jgi:xanthine/uracil/vitamin C permease (AzgA family)